MASITAIELGTDTCAFARTSVQRGEIHLTAAEILDPAAFPGADALTVAIRRTRRALALPRRCRVVVWGLPEGANRKDAAVKPMLAPLAGAGFRVERVVSPCNALAALARVKRSRGTGSTCWLAINRGGVAIVVIRPGKQLYAHSFVWDWTIGSSGSQARLLQRYSLVSHLSPQVKHAMAEARKAGSPVDAVVTCGNLPDLRSLTMPLIEELDIEVETLDSLEGLVVKPQAMGKLGESAAAIRLACAATIARGTRPWDESKQPAGPRTGADYLRAAALAAGVLAIGYLWYVRFAPPKPDPAPQSQQPSGQTTPAVREPANKPDSNAPAVSGPAKKPESNPPAGSVPGKKPESNPPPVSGPAKKPESNPARGPVPSPGVSGNPASPPPVGVADGRLADVVPRVTAILVSGDRRYATLEGGQIIGIGDRLGRRIIVGMDERSVLFQEPSGLRIRVGLGGRVLGVERR